MEYKLKKIDYFNFQCIKYNIYHKNVLFKGIKECPKTLVNISQKRIRKFREKFN